MANFTEVQEDESTSLCNLDDILWQQICDRSPSDSGKRALKTVCSKKLVYLMATLIVLYNMWTLVNVDKHVFQLQGFYEKWFDKDLAGLNSTQMTPDLDPEEQPMNITQAYVNGWVGLPGLANVDCAGAFNGSANNLMFPQTATRIFPYQLKIDSKDCESFRKQYGFFRHPKVSDEENDFPLAYIVLFYKDVDQVMFLLRAIYRPHNVYCLSVDTKASVEFLDAVRSVARCLPNVFVASKLESIVYAGFTRLMADIDCMEDLLLHPVQWKYTINLPGQEFPLRSNLEIVTILRLYNGSNDVEGITGDMWPERYLWKYIYVTNDKTGEVSLVKTNDKNDPPPHGIEIVKGSAYGTFSRDFVHFVVKDQVAKDFLAHCKSVYSPDEYFWASLHHSKTIDVPGRYIGEPEKKPWLSAYASWWHLKDPCKTFRTRGICIFSPEDLPHLQKRKELFANIFYITHYPAALHCIDQLIFNLTFAGTVRDLEYYQDLPFAVKKNSSS